MSEVEKMNSSSGAESADQPCGLTETQRSAGRWRPEVVAFADLMERKLRDNDHKPGWKGEDPGPLMHRLWEEAHELSVFFGPGSRSNFDAWSARIGEEAADVANFAMMIADVCGALSPAEMSASGPSEASAGNPVADEHLPTLQSQARRVEELEGALRKIANANISEYAAQIARSALSEGSGSSVAESGSTASPKSDSACQSEGGA